MNHQRKLRPQPALAHLTNDEREHIADLCRAHTFDKVLKTIAKPRDQGGYDTHVSRKVLQVLLDRSNMQMVLNQYNDHKISLDDYLALMNAAPLRYPEATLHLVQKSAFQHALNPSATPAQLACIQRVAAYPKNLELNERRVAAIEATAITRVVAQREKSLKNRQKETAAAADSTPGNGADFYDPNWEKQPIYRVVRRYKNAWDFYKNQREGETLGEMVQRLYNDLLLEQAPSPTPEHGNGKSSSHAPTL